MHKRGQITVFIILGILIITILGIVFYLYQDKLKINQNPEFDFSKTEVVKNYVEGCIEKVGNEALTKLGNQGGLINPLSYQNWNCILPGNCNKVSYVCYTTEYARCYYKRSSIKEDAIKEAELYLKGELNSCLNFQNIRSQGYEIETGNLKLNLTLGLYSTNINLDYPITIKGKSSEVKINKFSKNFNIPLGRLINVAEDLTDQAINNPQGVVNYQSYVNFQEGEIQIERHSYRDTDIYITKLRGNPYKFQFAIQTYVSQFP